MAEGFARKYGSDVFHAWSAGLAPAPIVQPMTIEVMNQKHVDITDQFPKSISELDIDAFDVIFNMSGMPLPAQVRGEVRIWDVQDPMAQSDEVYVKVRDQIEGLVMQYILELRRTVRKVGSGPISPSLKPVTFSAPESPVPSSQRFGFGRVRRARD
jgi:protein-tyrosine-phosphatase